MKTLFKNIKIRLLVALFIILSALFFSFGFVVIKTLESSYQESVEASLFTVLKDIKHDYDEDPTKEITLNEVKEEFSVPVLYAQVVAYDSMSNTPHILTRSNDLANESLTIEPNIIQKIFDRPSDVAFSITKNTKLTPNKIYIGTLFLAQNEFQMLFLQCAVPYNRHSAQIEEITSTLWIGLCALLAIVLLLAYGLISKSLSNVQYVTNAAKAMRGETEHSVIPKTHIASEIDDLIETFNTLLSELQHAYAQVKQFGQNASHELKTPLTIIKGEVEVGLRKERTNAEYQHILEKVAKEVSVLHEVIEKVLFLSSNTRSDLKKHFHEVYVDEILLEAIEEKRLLAESKKITLSVETLEPQNIRGSATLLKIAIANLIDNAIKYSPENSTIHVALKAHELSIKDEGMGIKTADLEHVFEQFYRTQESKESAQGSGLGLAIVKTILELHDLSITMESEEKKGTSAFIHF
jgi:signal transduction histidine kinase